MGKSQRDKGSRNERLLVEQLKRQGYEAFRVPLSGAALGFKGDVVFTRDGTQFVVEVKSRADSFKALYASVEHGKTRGLILEQGNDHSLLAAVGYDINDVLNYNDAFVQGESKLCRKLVNMHVWLGHAHVLAVKDDRKPFVFIQYYV